MKYLSSAMVMLNSKIKIVLGLILNKWEKECFMSNSQIENKNKYQMNNIKKIKCEGFLLEKRN